MTAARRTRQVHDPLAMRALAHPLRLRLLRLVRDRAPVTGAELATAVGESTASVSYHLSILARHGFVEPDPGVPQTRRHRPWRATYDSDVVASEGSGPIAETAEGALLVAMLRETRRAQDAYLTHHQELPEQWRDVGAFQHASLLLLPEDVEPLAAELAAVLGRYDRSRRDEPLPDSARRVTVSAVTVPDVPHVEPR